MARYIIKRILLMIPILFFVVFIVFSINRLTPGDPVALQLEVDYTQEQYEMKKAEMGLDKPFFTQFYLYIEGIVTRFDFGTSWQTKRSVTLEILERFPTTLKLGVFGVLVTIILGIPFGIISATKQYSPLDYAVTSTSLVLASMPNFWLALLMILLFALKLKWLPATGTTTWKHWILPVIAQGLGPVATVTRMTRSSMLEVVRQDYITTARAKGLSERTVILKHALKNALLPIVTVIGMQLGGILAGSVVVEAVFSIGGIGSLMMAAINNRNYPMIQGCVLFLSMSICIMNLIVDILYGFIDPRIMAQYKNNAKKSSHRKHRAEQNA